MSIGPIINLASGYLQSLLTAGAKGSSSTNMASATATNVGNTQDTNQLSPFAQILGSLQQLEQSSPPQYQEVTQRIAGNLRTASQSATSAGNTALGSELTRLSTDFKYASTSGQLPNVQDLAQAIGGGSNRHHPQGGGSLRSSTSDSGASANGSFNALSIIDNTLSSAGIQIG